MKSLSPTSIGVVVIAWFGLLGLLAKKATGSTVTNAGKELGILAGAPFSVNRWLLMVRTEATARQYVSNFNPKLILAIIWQESAGIPDVIGGVGEIGLMQLRPSTAADFGFSSEDLFEPALNVRAGIRYLEFCFEHMDDTCDALRAYNAGVTGARANPQAGLAYANAVMRKFQDSSITNWCGNG